MHTATSDTLIALSIEPYFVATMDTAPAYNTLFALSALLQYHKQQQQYYTIISIKTKLNKRYERTLNVPRAARMYRIPPVSRRKTRRGTRLTNSIFLYNKLHQYFKAEYSIVYWFMLA